MSRIVPRSKTQWINPLSPFRDRVAVPTQKKWLLSFVPDCGPLLWIESKFRHVRFVSFSLARVLWSRKTYFGGQKQKRCHIVYSKNFAPCRKIVFIPSRILIFKPYIHNLAKFLLRKLLDEFILCMFFPMWFILCLHCIKTFQISLLKFTSHPNYPKS